MKSIAGLLAALCLIACDAGPQVPAPKEVGASDPAGAAGAAEPGVVRISAEMLRDLRVTTAPVEEHRGAQSASMLGELSVNDNRYAEVGAPLQARVTRLLATLGQSVRAGTPLAILQSGELARARSEVVTALSRVELARQTLERRKTLNAERIVPTREVQEAENELRRRVSMYRGKRRVVRKSRVEVPRVGVVAV